MPLLPRFLVLSVLAVPVAAQQRIAVGDEVRIAAGLFDERRQQVTTVFR